jgi:integrase/recombinase XerD
MEEYLRELEKKNTYKGGRKRFLSVFKEYLLKRELSLSSFKVKDAQDFQNTLMMQTEDNGNIHYSRKTVTLVMTFTKTFYHWLKQKGLVSTNPFMHIKGVRGEKRLPENVLNEEEMQKVLRGLRNFLKARDLKESKVKYKVHVMAELAYATGMSRSELLGLNVCDLDVEKSVIHLKQRDCFLDEYTRQVLKIYLTRIRPLCIKEQTNFLFTGRVNLRTAVNLFLGQECEKQGTKKISLKDIRHSLAAHLLKNGCDIRYLKELLGHEDLGTTQKYLRVDKEKLKNVLDVFHPRSRMRT